MKRISLLFAAMLAVVAAAGWTKPAISAERDAEEEGFSAYSVARLKIFEGTAWVRQPDSGEWEEYTTNTPIPERSRVNVPEGAEAELQFHGGQYVLLTGGSEVDIKKFNEDGTAFRLRSGEIRFDLPADDFSPVGVTVPGGGKANFSVPGRYWLSVGDDGGTRLVVRSGESDVSVERGNFHVKAGEEAAIGQDVRVSAYRGSGGETEEAPPPMTEEEKQAAVPPAAAYELRNYGEWVHTNDYGTVWRPRVVAGWSPYYYGRWVWVSPYGWTWVSNEPWGWYPYHFGWWASDPFFGWVWCPFRSFVSVNFVFGSARFTHFHRNAFFFPATVRFVRDGGFVRWVPLRPGERFVRSGFTRSNARLARWDRPIPRGTVFVRSPAKDRGKPEWRGWSAAQRSRGQVVVRERDARPGGSAVGREVPQVREERQGVRPQKERTRPEGQEKMRQRNLDRQERQPQRDFRGREGRPGGGSTAPGRPRQDMGTANRPERARPARSQAVTPARSEVMKPPRRVAPAGSEMRPRVEAPPPYRGEVRRGEPAGRIDRPRPGGDVPKGNIAPDRGPAGRSPGQDPGQGRGNIERGTPERGGGGRR